MAYLLAVNTSRRNKLPKDATSAEWATYNDAFRNVELTPGAIAAAIRDGYAIAPQCNGRRKASNFRLAQHIGIDLDHMPIALDDLTEHPLARLAGIVHTTASSTPQMPRYRVIYFLSEPIRDPAHYSAIVRAFLRAWATADPSCKDPARLFFGAEGCSLLLMPDNVVTADDLAHIMATYPPDDARGDDGRPALTTPDDAQIRPPSGIVAPAELSPERRAAHLEAMLSKVRTCPDGTKWETLRDVSYTMGGYARAGYFTFGELQTALRQAIESRRATVASMAAAHDTIDRALAAGWAHPLYYDVPSRQASPPDARTRLRQILTRRRAELETAIMDAPDNAPDFDELTREYSIVMTRLEAVT